MKSGAKCRKMAKLFQFVPDTLGHPFYTFSNQIHHLQSKKTPRKFEKLYFGQFFLLTLIFDLLPPPKFYCTPYPVIIKVCQTKLLFSKHMPIKRYGGKPFGGSAHFFLSHSLRKQLYKVLMTSVYQQTRQDLVNEFSVEFRLSTIFNLSLRLF